MALVRFSFVDLPSLTGAAVSLAVTGFLLREDDDPSKVVCCARAVFLFCNITTVLLRAMLLITHLEKVDDFIGEFA